MSAPTLDVLRIADIGELNSSPGFEGVPFQTAYRITLQSALRDLALDENGTQ